MLSIVITNNNKENIQEIYRYITHINNINKNINIQIQILIINWNWNWNILEFENVLDFTNIDVKLYNYKCDYDDSIHNEMLKNCLYDIILYTTLNTYLTEPILEYISLNEIKENSFIRTNVIELDEIPIEFSKNYSNNIFKNISEEIKYICNENGKNILLKEQYIEEFNNINNTIINISSKNIKQHNLYYLNNSSDFLLVSKKNILNIGFNITNTNNHYTFQYLLLNLIKNKYNMIKLPLILAVYQKTTNIEIPIISYNLNVICSNEYNTHINYKIYDIIDKKEKSYIRSHIKKLNGIHSNDLVKINKNIEKKNKELIEENNIYIKKIEHYENEIKEIVILKNVLHKKYIDLEIKYELLYDNNNINKQKYIEKLNIINSNINEIIIDEKKKLFE